MYKRQGYRLEKLEPIFRAEGVPIARIIVGVRSGRGMDLTKAQGWPVDWEYFIPNLRYWFNESLLYPFIGGDGMGGAPPRGSVIPSVNLMLPYAYPRFLRDAPEQAVLQLCRTAQMCIRDRPSGRPATLHGLFPQCSAASYLERPEFHGAAAGASPQ